ncbi:nuclear factor of activated T-cells, cytoplasmic 2 [Betta splendens]|uniref:Nuclear factor of activated T-cells, cytoplasmic 2 n=1 Tax=Betta splendens TaxID=158456 RepID=A0A6P7MIQ9_BETSP|nr:nuclear factor of activated T-cells, cytoplasmic 2 [Betta splendens]
MTSGGLGLAEGLAQDISQDELDFSDLFLYNPPGEDFPVGCDKDDPSALLQNEPHPPLLVVDHQAAFIPASGHSPSPHPTATEAAFDSLGLTSRPGNIPAPSPRIEITPSGDSLSSQPLEPSPGSKALAAYRDCVSPASSNSSTGWPAEGSPSPCPSPSICGGMGLSALDLCPGLQGIHTSSTYSSPGGSLRNSITDETYLLPQHQHQHQRSAAPHPHQRSRSASPHGKRAHDPAQPCQGATPVKQRSRSPSPIPSPHEGSYYLHQYQAQADFQVPAQSSCAYGEGYDWATDQKRMGRAGADLMSDTFYRLPAVWAAPHPVPHGAHSSLSVAPLPSLEWSLPSQSGQYDLRIQQQPRSHHRAQYETEGSRGAVKTPKGGHPEVQLCGYQGPAPLGLQVFIGTADERLLKPHAFYQVYRITGKTVTTPSSERMISGTKVLEIPLEPKNHMRVVIDCVGILKLRNADIELRNGETDIGRKNTRVRLVFRVHVPQPGGQVVSLQVASDPIECSQRSAQELPAVERQDLERCSALGGQQMVLTGQNFTPGSKVVFSEKTQDGQQIWEVEATVDRDKTQANLLFVEVPPYRDQTICHPAKVNFYVINGKKKRSQPQHFLYTPAIAIKAEPLDDYHLHYGYSDSQSQSGLSMKSLYHHLEQDNSLQAFSVSPSLHHLSTVDPRACMLTADALDDQAMYYQSKAGSLISSHVLYHTASQQYSSSGTTLLGGSPKALHPASAPSQCVSTRIPVGKLTEGPHAGDSFEACSGPRHRSFVQSSLPLGRSPPLRYIQGQAQGKGGCRGEPDGGNHGEQTPERVIVKQENLSYAYLEDVNDIIRRDLKGHNGD